MSAEGSIGQAAVVELWGRDRAALLSCRRRHAGLRSFYAVRDGALQ